MIAFECPGVIARKTAFVPHPEVDWTSRLRNAGVTRGEVGIDAHHRSNRVIEEAQGGTGVVVDMGFDKNRVVESQKEGLLIETLSHRTREGACTWICDKGLMKMEPSKASVCSALQRCRV